jgi:hypothetical protein
MWHWKKVRDMTAHEQMLIAANLLILTKGRDEFSTSEIFSVLKGAGSTHPINTIQAEMLRCCTNCPRENETTYDYFERVTRDRYRLIKKIDFLAL